MFKNFVVKRLAVIIGIACAVAILHTWKNSAPLSDFNRFFSEYKTQEHPYVRYLRMLKSTAKAKPRSSRIFRNYSHALNSMADEKNVVVLVPVDSGVLDMALNLFYTSLVAIWYTQSFVSVNR